ncbi:MAG TPA: PaaI family thioesterase [candidate division Zixibacteria bacterium]|nr:PaaI family thioesterase [candidate division Zixibacteria bacterium]
MENATGFRSHEHCFACGPLNADGLGLVFEQLGKTVTCRTSVDWRFQSYEGIVHGGILASIADATMVHLVRRKFGGSPMTCSLEVRYKAAVQIGDVLEARAEIVKAKCGMVWAVCHMQVEGNLRVEAKAALKVIRGID